MSTICIQLGTWQQLQKDASAVRIAVFVQEQNIPEKLEWDEMDAVSLHAVAYDEQGVAVGTARLLPDAHIGRMAVIQSARGRAIGTQLLQRLITEAKQRGEREVILNAQQSAMPFYERLGFIGEGSLFDDAGIPHLKMRLVFNFN
jgi:predicted GNAT family N-acyltransferase